MLVALGHELVEFGLVLGVAQAIEKFLELALLLFETALSMLAKVPLERVAALIASGRSTNLRALLQKASLPQKTFPAFAAAIDVIRKGDPRVGHIPANRKILRRHVLGRNHAR